MRQNSVVPLLDPPDVVDDDSEPAEVTLDPPLETVAEVPEDEDEPEEPPDVTLVTSLLVGVSPAEPPLITEALCGTHDDGAFRSSSGYLDSSYAGSRYP